MGQIKRLAIIVWQHGGVFKAWPIAVFVATFSKKLDEWAGYPMSAALPTWAQPTWWWGLVVLVLWVVWSLAARVLRYETPALSLETVRDERDGSWWIEVRNVGGKALADCAVDIERIETPDGKRCFPHSFGLLRPGDLSNPFPLRATQPKQGKFAEIFEGRVNVLGMTVDRQPTRIVLLEDKYILTVGAYSEQDGSQCKRVLNLERRDGRLLVS